MIFSSQLGKLDGVSTEQDIKAISNHLRKMQDELEYRLSVLDSSNINEIDTDQTNVFVKGEPINNIITDQNGKLSMFEQTIDGFRKTVADYEEGYSQWTQTVDGFTQQVGNYEDQYSVWQQTVDGFTQQVADYKTGYSSWQQTVEGFSQQVANYQGQYSTWEQTVSGFQQTVTNMQTGLSMALKMDANGVYITDQNGKTVKISGEQIDASTIRVNSLYGGDIYLKYPVIGMNGSLLGYNNAGLITVTSADSAYYAFDLTSYGALRLSAQTGDVFIRSEEGSVILSGDDDNRSQGNFVPSAISAYTCGSSNYPWSVVYASTGEISTSDREKKNSIDYDTEQYGKLFDLLKPCSFKMNDGTSDRRHVGMIAQDVEDAMESAGISSKDFAGFVKSPKKDEDKQIIEGEYDYFLRYSEFIGLCIAEIQKLKARVYELERKEQNDGSAC